MFYRERDASDSQGMAPASSTASPILPQRMPLNSARGAPSLSVVSLGTAHSKRSPLISFLIFKYPTTYEQRLPPQFYKALCHSDGRHTRGGSSVSEQTAVSNIGEGH